MIWRIVLPILATVAITSPADAHWKFAQWGMTPEAVLKASGSKAYHLTISEEESQSYTDGSRTAKLGMRHIISGVPFDVYFLFDKNHKLITVTLWQKSGSSKDVIEDLAALYGKPSSRSDLETVPKSEWFRNDDHIILLKFKSNLELKYKRRSEASSD